MDMDLGIGAGGGGGVGQFPLEQWLFEMPVCTRWWTTATVAVSVLVQCHVISPFQLFYSFRSVFVKNQVCLTVESAGARPMGRCENADDGGQFWRLISTFVYFGPFSLDLLFQVFFLQRYSRLLEESAGRSAAHFSWLLVYATGTLLALSPMLSMPFLGSALSSTLVYIWARRNPETRLSFLGLLVFTAPYLPWILMAFSLVLHNHIPKDEICGAIVGHGESFCPAAGVTCFMLIVRSVVFLQRCLSTTSRWPSTLRSTSLVDSAIRASSNRDGV